MKSLIRFFLFVLLLTCTTFAQNGGYAVKFNGIDGKARIMMDPCPGSGSSTVTLEFWFEQVTAQTGLVYLADLHCIQDSDNRRIMPYLNSSVIGIYCAPNTNNNNNAIDVSTGVTVIPNVWYHVAITINGSTLNMYVNGKHYINTSLTDSFALTAVQRLLLASDYWATSFANIKVDEVREWSTERTEAQIKANMYKQVDGSEAGLIAYYLMSNGSGSSLSGAQTAGSYTATLLGGYTWVASGAFADNRNALNFDGSDDYVDCGNSASVQRNGTQSFTLEAWVKPAGGTWMAVISKFEHTASHEGYSLEIFSDNKPSLLFGNNWSNWYALSSSTALTAGVWSHIAATYDGSTAKIYVNGALTGSYAWTNGLTDSGTNLLLGARGWPLTTFYQGQMDEARVWTIARTDAEIRQDMCRTLAGNEAGLAAYYRLDQIDDSTTYDLTSNANNGTLTNMNLPTDWVASDAFNTWIGAESTSWSDAGNWSKGTVPSSSNSVGLYKWALGNETTISTSPTIQNLYISSSASPTLSSSMSINMNLLLGKDFNLNGQAVTLGSSATLVEGSFRLYGTSGTISTTRSLSNISSSDIAGLGAIITTSANMGSTTITRGHAAQTGNGNSSILRYYDITPANNSGLNASLVFNYSDAEFNSLAESNFALYKSTDGGTTWADQAGTLSTGNNTITKTGISSFSRWTIGSTSYPLEIPLGVPVATAATANTQTSFSANWNIATGATKYYLDVSTNNTFSSFINGFNNLDVGNVITYPVTGLNLGTTYYYRVRAYRNSTASNNSNAISTATISSAPELSNIETSTLEYIVKGAGLTITGSLEIKDAYDVNLASAVISISTNYVKGEDKLIFTDQNGITGSWNNNSGTLTLTGAVTLDNYKTALRTVQYSNSSVKPSASTRIINFIVSNGALVSNSVSRSVNVTGSNTAPVLGNIGTGPVRFTKGLAETVISDSIIITDVDNKYLLEGSVSFTDGFITGEDEVTFTNTSDIIGSYDTTSGILRLAGQATVEEYQNAFRSVRYKNAKGFQATTNNKKISFEVKDGELTSNNISREIEIISPLVAPSNLTMKIENGNVKLNWKDNSDNENGFKISRMVGASTGKETTSSFTIIDSVAANVTEYIDKTAAETYSYTYYLLAYNNSGAVSDTTADNQGTISVPLKAPTELKTVANSKGSIDLNWKDNSIAEEKYIVERSEITNDNFKEIKSCGTDTSSYCDENIVNNKKYFYRVCALKGVTKSEYSNEVFVTAIVSDVAEESGIPKEYKLYQSYPNPFNPTTTIKFSIPKTSFVTLKVFDILGKEIATLVNENKTAGSYKIIFNANSLSSGIYFYRVQAGNYSDIKKLILMK